MSRSYKKWHGDIWYRGKIKSDMWHSINYLDPCGALVVPGWSLQWGGGGGVLERWLWDSLCTIGGRGDQSSGSRVGCAETKDVYISCNRYITDLTCVIILMVRHFPKYIAASYSVRCLVAVLNDFVVFCSHHDSSRIYYHKMSSGHPCLGVCVCGGAWLRPETGNWALCRTGLPLSAHHATGRHMSATLYDPAAGMVVSGLQTLQQLGKVMMPFLLSEWIFRNLKKHLLRNSLPPPHFIPLSEGAAIMLVTLKRAMLTHANLPYKVC